MGIMRRPSMDAIEAEDVAARVYVGNLKPKVNETHLTEIFVRFGKLLHVWVARKPPGFAFVQFLNQSDAECAVESFQGEDGLEILGKRVKVQMAGDKAQSKMAKERPSRRDDRENDRRKRRSRSRSPSVDESRGDRSRNRRRTSDGRRRRASRSRSRSMSPSRTRSRRRRSRSTSIRSRNRSRSLSPRYRRKRSRSSERCRGDRSRSRRRSRS